MKKSTYVRGASLTCRVTGKQETTSYFLFADDSPGIVSGVGNRARSRALTNADLSSHAINQFLGIVADSGLKHRVDVLDLFNAL
jgi:hypothetical protein